MLNLTGINANGEHELFSSDANASSASTVIGYGIFGGANVTLGIIGADGSNHFFPDHTYTANFIQEMTHGRAVRVVVRVENATATTVLNVNRHVV